MVQKGVSFRSQQETDQKEEKMGIAIYEIMAAGKKSKVVGTEEMAETVKVLKEQGWTVKVRKIS